MRSLVALACLLLAICDSNATDNFADLAEDYKGKGNVHACVANNQNAGIQCKSGLCIPFDGSYRDSICQCDCPDDQQSCNKKCLDPECSGCTDKADEECIDGTFWCGPGKCVSFEKYWDSTTVVCNWNCIQKNARAACVENRKNSLNAEWKANSAGPDATQLSVKRFCNNTLQRQSPPEPYDCYDRKNPSNQARSLRDGCQEPLQFIKYCREKVYEQEDWYKQMKPM